MRTKKLYISPAIRAHKLKLQACMQDSSSVQTEGNGTTDDFNDAKRSRFTYDGFGAKSDETNSDSWK